MPRPRKRRVLASNPRPAIYKPAGVPLNRLTCVSLRHEELEALRLADLERLPQVEAAAQMGVSRSTFQRMLARARGQVALALAGRHALRIEGGTYEVRPPRPRGPRRQRERVKV
jgi:predicted DNA-binding protein (UPF0251 family)